MCEALSTWLCDMVAGRKVHLIGNSNWYFGLPNADD